MKVEYESGFWADLKERWTFGDQLAIRSAARVGDDVDPELATVALMQRVILSWSEGEVTPDAIRDLDQEIGNWLYGQCVEAINTGPKVAAASDLSSLPQLVTAG